MKKKKKKKKRKINYQKVFCVASFVFIFCCIIWYGGRFIYLYKENEKISVKESITLSSVIKTENHEKDTFKQIGQDYYFYGDARNNYVNYSNLLWRIIKIHKDNTVVLVSDNIVGTLAYGNNDVLYQESSLYQWLNTNSENIHSGIFEKILNQKEKYLMNHSTCVDKVHNTSSNIDNITCEKVFKEGYVGLLSVQDYIYTGSSKSFINNNKYSYLANKNDNNDIWYINKEGKLGISDGEDILGIKVTITLNPNLEIKSGDGSLENPYSFEEETSIIGSYVKLDNDIWRIYEEKDGIVKLVLQDTLKDLDNEIEENFKYSYSKKNYSHNDTTYGTLAYYLNKTYLNSLSYKDIILDNTYVNGVYDNDNKYQLNDIYENTIQTKVTLPSIGDIIFNDKLDDYFTNTGTSKESSYVYIQKENGIVTTKNVTSKAYIVPCISIHKDKLISGTGSNNDPYRTE